jgi:hypothetical protein
MILPSLDVAELIDKLKLDELKQITIIVGVNSDVYNRGLGVTLKADPSTAAAEDPEEWYEYGGSGADLEGGSNSIKFHPNMDGGQLRVEGSGGFHNTDIGFTPPGWSGSGNKLAILEITISADGNNEISFKIDGQTWTGTWNNMLISNSRIPAVFAHVDLGGTEDEPLIVGQVLLRLETSASAALTFFREYSIAMSKAIAGFLRLLLEDVFQAACQTVYMIKLWKLMSMSAKAFTILSISSGVILSVIGPTAELQAARAARQKAVDAGQEADLGLEENPKSKDYAQLATEEQALSGDKSEPLLESAEAGAGERHVWTRRGVQQMPPDLAQELGYPKVGSPVTSSQLNQLADEGIELNMLIQDGMLKVQEDKPKVHANVKARNILTLRNLPLEDLLLQRNRGARHVNRKSAYALLQFSSIVFWTLMATMPFILQGAVTCDGGPPAVSVYLFFAHTSLDLLAQLWISAQTRHGFIMFAQMSRQFWFGIAFTCLCRFDTFGDVINTAKLFKCEPITWFSIKDHYFHMPFGIPLAYVSLATLVFGVFVCQAIPGMVLLFRKSHLPIALKLNEFNLLLTVMKTEIADVEFELEDDLETAS